MGPRSIDRGIDELVFTSQIVDAMLQWGRDLSIAEFRRRGDVEILPHRASMGPRSIDRGILFSGYLSHTHPAPLQWGRDLSIAEFNVSVPTAAFVYMLQWGRDLSIAELRAVAQRVAHRAGFNGAAIYRSRNCPARTRLSLPHSTASMGPRSIDRGIHGCQYLFTHLPRCFNGAAIYRSRNWSIRRVVPVV